MVVLLPVAAIGYEDLIKGQLLTYRDKSVMVADMSAPSTGAYNSLLTIQQSAVYGWFVMMLVVSACRGIKVDQEMSAVMAGDTVEKVVVRYPKVLVAPTAGDAAVSWLLTQRPDMKFSPGSITVAIWIYVQVLDSIYCSEESGVCRSEALITCTMLLIDGHQVSDIVTVDSEYHDRATPISINGADVPPCCSQYYGCDSCVSGWVKSVVTGSVMVKVSIVHGSQVDAAFGVHRVEDSVDVSELYSLGKECTSTFRVKEVWLASFDMSCCRGVAADARQVHRIAEVSENGVASKDSSVCQVTDAAIAISLLVACSPSLSSQVQVSDSDDTIPVRTGFTMVCIRQEVGSKKTAIVQIHITVGSVERTIDRRTKQLRNRTFHVFVVRVPLSFRVSRLGKITHVLMTRPISLLLLLV